MALSVIVSALMASGQVPAAPGALSDADPSRVTPKLLKKCAKCHYETGVSDDPEMPHLAGQRASYMYKQLQDFKADARDGGRMNKTAKKLSEQEMADLATLFSAKPLPPEDDFTPVSAPGLVTDGDPGRGIKACAGCHGQDGRGRGDTYDAPALAGMPLLYFRNMMLAFRDGERANDADGVMRESANGLSDDEISGLAAYYLALGGRNPLPE
jgi:cytochrome c553